MRRFSLRIRSARALEAGAEGRIFAFRTRRSTCRLAHAESKILQGIPTLRLFARDSTRGRRKNPYHARQPAAAFLCDANRNAMLYHLHELNRTLLNPLVAWS